MASFITYVELAYGQERKGRKGRKGKDSEERLARKVFALG